MFTEEGSVKVIDDYTVQFTLEVGMNGPYPPMGFKPILPKHFWEDYTDDMIAFENDPLIGGGPFKVKEFQAGEYLLLEAFDDYYAGQPEADEVKAGTLMTEMLPQVGIAPDPAPMATGSGKPYVPPVWRMKRAAGTRTTTSIPIWRS